MADEAHLAVLKQGADAWNAWQAAHPDTPADLANGSLRGLDLARGNLAGADCRKAGLRGTISQPRNIDRRQPRRRQFLQISPRCRRSRGRQSYRRPVPQLRTARDRAELAVSLPRSRPCVWRSRSQDRRPTMNGTNGAQHRDGIETRLNQSYMKRATLNLARGKARERRCD